MSKKLHLPPLYLGEFELLVLLSVLRLGEGAYGVTIRQELERETSRQLTLGTIYKTLSRLEDKGYVAFRIGAPTAERGGRRKKFYRLEPLGTRAINESFSALRRLSRGLGAELEAL